MKNRKLELKQEKEKLESTIHTIKTLIQDVNNQRDQEKKETMQALHNMSYSDINQQHEIMAVSAQNEEDAENLYQKYLRALKSPYFCRIDFTEENTEVPQTFYIGKRGLTNHSGDQIVLDWRTPVANIYYANTIGKVSYTAPGGEIKGNLSLKRHYLIEEGQLESMMDVDVSANDDFLQMALGDSKDNRLKDIVSTIQSEQNEIIRAPLSVPLVVQGVAGSGKTTIALHRIAYLIYTYQKDFTSNDFLIIAPNDLFLDYISAVLPELGVDKVQQSTFVNLAAQIISGKYKLADTNVKLATLLSTKVSIEDKELIKESSRLKGSLDFITVLEQYVYEVTEQKIPDKDFILSGHVLFTSQQVRSEIFLIPDIGWAERLQYLRKRLNIIVKKMREQIKEEIQKHFDEQIEDIRDHMPANEERRLCIVEIIHKKEQAISNYNQECKICVSDYMSYFPKINVIKDYFNLLSNTDDLCRLSNYNIAPRLAEHIAEQCCAMGKGNTVEIEDLAPLMFLEMKLKGVDKAIGARFIAIDEAQDFSELQIFVLKQVLKTDKFSIFGDISQGIHEYRGVNDWMSICENVFGGCCEYRVLKQSYRTTIEVMDFANCVLSHIQDEKLVIAKPVVRHGEKPQCFTLSTETQLYETIVQKIKEHIANGYSSIAIITKTEVDAKRINKKMRSFFPDIQLLKDSDTAYGGGVMVLPAHLSKGLEFDAVVVTCLDDDYTKSNLDIKLLYVAITRALHRMDVVHLSGKMQLISECSI